MIFWSQPFRTPFRWGRQWFLESRFASRLHLRSLDGIYCRNVHYCDVFESGNNFLPQGKKHLVIKYSVFYLFIQCYVFLINCGLSLVFIYVSGRFSPAFNLVILTVSSSDAQCEICFPKLILAFLRVRSHSCSSSHQQQCEPQQKTCETFFSYTRFMCFQALSYFSWGLSSILQWSLGRRSTGIQEEVHWYFSLSMAEKQCGLVG